MTTTQTQLRRGTNTQVNAMTPVDGEIVYNTTDDRVHLGDGTTAGGIPHANFRDVRNEVFTTATVGGTANAITLTLTPPLAAYASGVRIRFRATLTNTGATTVNVNGLGNRNVLKLSSTSLVALAANDVVAGVWYEIHDDGTQFQLFSGAGGGGGVSNRQVFTTSGTWTKPAGFSPTAMVLLQAWGGGGGGSHSPGGNGGNGGNTTIGSLLIAYGGAGGINGGAGGAGGGHYAIGGGAAQFSNSADGYTGGGGAQGSSSNFNGGQSVYGGGGGAAGGSGTYLGGVSQFGGSGGNGGANATAPGGGGSGGSPPSQGGGGGGYKYLWLPLSSLGATETITIGAGGSLPPGNPWLPARGEARITVFG